MAVLASYQIGLLGRPNGLKEQLEASLRKRLADLGMVSSTLNFISESDVGRRNRKMPFIAVFVGYQSATDVDHLVLRDLIADSVVIIPLVESIKSASSFIPSCIGHINCLEISPADPQLERVVTLLLENFQLLRSDRRLFISYRRVEAQSIAIQLYENLDAAGFDVFLDTHGVPPAVDFQSTLWHRLADSDVIVLLDTPRFRESRWTREELSRANATSIQILHLLWPDASPDANSAFSEFYPLDAFDFSDDERVGERARLKEDTLNSIRVRAESLRARAISARHRYLVDNFCDQARAVGRIANVQSARFISLETPDAARIAVVPAVGVPNAARYQQIEKAIVDSGDQYKKIWLLYDERGILDDWLQHVSWLNKHLPLIAVRVSEAMRRIEDEGK